MLERIVYVSRAAAGPRARRDLRHHPGGAPACNARRGVTGALVCLDGWFAQVIEGPAAGGSTRSGSGSPRDPRHSGLEPAHPRARALPALRRPGDGAQDRAPASIRALSATFGYRPGFPVEDFPPAVLLEFLIAACRRHGLRAGLDKGAAAFLASKLSAGAERRGTRVMCMRPCARSWRSPPAAGTGWSSGGSCRPSTGARWSTSAPSRAADADLAPARYYAVRNVTRQQPASPSR